MRGGEDDKQRRSERKKEKNRQRKKRSKTERGPLKACNRNEWHCTKE